MALTIDPRLPLPPVEGAKYDERVSVDALDRSPETLETDPSAITFEFSSEDYSGAALQPPSNIDVVSQTVRVGSTGQMSVSIILEIEDVIGAADYERRESS